LIPDASHKAAPGFKVLEIPLSQTTPSPSQPRSNFNDDSLNELAESIREFGVLQPVVVRDLGGDRYELIAGERRYLASQRAALEKIPAIVREATDAEAMEVALVENLQREQLTPLECARAYQSLMDVYSLTQEELSRKLSKGRPTIANTLRLLQLPVEAQLALQSGRISEGHGKALLTLDSAEEQIRLLHEVLTKNLSVRETELAAKRMNRGRNVPRGTISSGNTGKTPLVLELEQALREYLGTKVSVTMRGAAGVISIEFYSAEDLTRLFDAMGVPK